MRNLRSAEHRVGQDRLHQFDRPAPGRRYAMASFASACRSSARSCLLPTRLSPTAGTLQHLFGTPSSKPGVDFRLGERFAAGAATAGRPGASPGGPAPVSKCGDAGLRASPATIARPFAEGPLDHAFGVVRGQFGLHGPRGDPGRAGSPPGSGQPRSWRSPRAISASDSTTGGAALAASTARAAKATAQPSRSAERCAKDARLSACALEPPAAVRQSHVRPSCSASSAASGEVAGGEVGLSQDVQRLPVPTLIVGALSNLDGTGRVLDRGRPSRAPTRPAPPGAGPP